MRRYLSIWNLQKDEISSNTISKLRLLSDLESISPDVPGTETLAFLEREGIIEPGGNDGYCLSPFGVGLWNLMKDEFSKII